MSSAALKNGPRGGGTYLARARAAWQPAPDWIVALATRLDSEVARGGTQATIAKALGVTNASTISSVIGNKYQGRLERIEARVKGAFMSATVECPALAANIGRDVCADHQRRKFSAANPQLVRLHKMCPGCANFMGGN